MFNRSLDIMSSILFVAMNLTQAMKVASTTGRLFAKLVNSTEFKKPSSVHSKTTKAQSNLTFGLNPVRQANSAEEMAILLPELSANVSLY